MRILVFGQSHVGALAQSFRKKSLKHNFFDNNEIDFIAVSGSKFKKVKTSSNDQNIHLPAKTYSNLNSSWQNQTEHNTEYKAHNISTYDVVIWTEGRNILSSYHSLFGGKQSAPVLLTEAFASILFDRTLRKRKHFLNLRSSCTNTRFLYTGAPLLFRSHRQEKLLTSNSFTRANSIHCRNVRYLRENMLALRRKEGIVMSPAACIHPSGLLSLSKFARDSKSNGHGSSNYGKYLWKEIINLIE